MEYPQVHVIGNINNTGNHSRRCVNNNALPLAPSKRKRPSVEIVWTAKRCQRLLRSITSRLNLLRRLHRLAVDVHRLSPAPLNGDSVKTPLSESSSPLGSRLESRASPESPNSPEWLPGRGARSGATYMRTKRRVQPKMVAQSVRRETTAFPTPLVRKLLTAEIHNPLVPSSSPLTIRPETLNRLNARKSLKLPVRPADSTEEAYKNLLVAFETFLSNTRDTCGASHRGIPSLLDMATRKVSHYIELEEYCKAPLGQDDGDPCDVASDMYAELEDIGTRPGGGWQGLRLVIKAHCMRHIERAIQDGILPVTVLRSLLDVCVRYDAVREAHIIIEGYVHSDSSAHDVRDFFLGLESYCLGYGGEAFWLRNLTLLLAAGKILPDELLRHNTIWRISIRLMATRNHIITENFLSVYAACLSEARAQMALTLPLQRLQDVLSVLLAMCLSFENAEHSCLPHNIAAMIHRTTTILFSSPQTTPGRKVGLPFLSACLLMLCLHGSQDDRCSNLNIDSVVDLLGDVEGKNNQHKGPEATKVTASFACAVASIMDRMDDGSGTVIMRRMILAISQAAHECDAPSTRRYLRGLALDCTLSYPGTCEDQECVDAARGLTRPVRAHKVHVLPHTQLSENTKAFRWEEGLCEWIQATPARHGEIRSNVQHASSPAQMPTKRETCVSRGHNATHTVTQAVSITKELDTTDLRNPLGISKPNVIRRRHTAADAQIKYTKSRWLGKENIVMDPPRTRRSTGGMICHSNAAAIGESDDDDDELSLISPVKRRKTLTTGLSQPVTDQARPAKKPSHMLGAGCNDSDDELGM